MHRWKPASIGVERYRPARMVARRLSCRAPSGLEFPIVLLGDVVIAPESVCKEPGLGWLELERLPRLSMEISQRLEGVIEGLRIGCWPFCASLERWNKAAEVYPCLAVAVDDDAAATVVTSCELQPSDLRTSKRGGAMLQSERPRAEFGLTTGDRFRAGSLGVVELFVGVRRVLWLMARGLALAACVYYVLGTADWIWGLRDGMTGAEIQSGLVLILAALVFSGITRMFGDRRSSPTMASSLSAGSDGHQTVVSELPRVYRVGIALQFVAFLGFVIW
jgi:hypothetical protein